MNWGWGTGYAPIIEAALASAAVAYDVTEASSGYDGRRQTLSGADVFELFLAWFVCRDLSRRSGHDVRQRYIEGQNSMERYAAHRRTRFSDGGIMPLIATDDRLIGLVVGAESGPKRQKPAKSFDWRVFWLRGQDLNL